MHLATYSDHLQYGSVVRSGPNRLVFNTATAVHDIYANARVNKGHSYSYVSRSGNPSMWSTLDREAHHRKRKLVGPVVSERCGRLAVDIVGLLAFGYPLNTQTEDTNKLVPEYFPSPFAFRPGRWLAHEHEMDQEREVRVTTRRAFQPFLLGDRGWAGKAMAYLELSMALAKTIWYFDFERVPGEAGKAGEGIPGSDGWRGRRDEFQLYDGVVVSHDGPNLVFKTRGRYWEDMEASEAR
ncbi:hypothetical protein F4813DRAFT_343486 [Daldinia decipiens]|uniref:uncharacterized protein n=1 Tax=Daldinia decipiens TaxID=326647 RepID=UPI0020C1E428|nr:uncharacterized protein F4813DRAFT_343486 [Daldinia decipiens]KAI1662108.1 hypothetical protein F4813DRAFT_343486 [Daldinia decipiens]